MHNFSLAPLSSRSDVALLGLLHEVAHQRVHPELAQLFPRAPAPRQNAWTATLAARHDKQLAEQRTADRVEEKLWRQGPE